MLTQSKNKKIINKYDKILLNHHKNIIDIHANNEKA